MELDGSENIADLGLTTGAEVNQWPIVEEATLGFTEDVEPEKEEDKGRRLILELVHHLPGEDDLNMTRFSLQPGVIEEIIGSVCSANTKDAEEAQTLYTIILGAIKWFREGRPE